jgi:hypothetical protein
MLRSPPGTRRGQTAAYLCFAGAGITAAVFPSPSIQSTAGSRILVGIWIVFLTAGGLLSAAGRMAGRWPGEFVGIPLLAAAFLVYTVAIVYATVLSGRLTGLTAGTALAAIFWLVAARWFEVNQIRGEAVRHAKEERDDPGGYTPDGQRTNGGA